MEYKWHLYFLNYINILSITPYRNPAGTSSRPYLPPNVNLFCLNPKIVDVAG